MKLKKKKNKNKKLSQTKREKTKIMLLNFRNLIEKNKDILPKVFNTTEKINTDSWFDLTNTYATTNHNKIEFIKNKPEKEIIKCIKYDMIISAKQKIILDKWFEASTKMYNETLKYIKNNFNFTKNEITKSVINIQEKNNIYEISELDEIFNSKNIYNYKYNKYILKKIKKITDILNNNESFEHTLGVFNFDKKNYFNDIYLKKQLKTIKAKIIEESEIENNPNTRIYAHILDESLSQLASNIKSARTNIMNGNIKKFRLKYWKLNRPSKTIEIEKELIKNNEICPSRLNINEKIKYYYNNEECIPQITCGVKINYNSILNKYTLLVPIREAPIINNEKDGNLISLDPGLRTFMTGISENLNVKIGTNVNKIIENDIKKINRINNNKNIPKRIKKKNERIINKKIKNKIDDLHWKTANYLVKKYNCILLGNMSAKSIVKKKKSVLSDTQKVACLRTGYYTFAQRLQFKCKQNNVLFKLVNESYTSKTCSNCGTYDETLGKSTIYNCNNCNIVIDRDINGARNIYIKKLLFEMPKTS